MNEDEQYIYDHIVSQVNMGFDDPEDIKVSIGEMVEDEGFDITDDWINNHVEETFRKLMAESKTWTHPTDTEKLALVFDELATEHRMITLHKAGYTTSDGEGDVIELELRLRENGVQSEGYCFYHEQDLERVLAPSGILGLAYQKINNNDDAVTLRIDSIIAAKLRQHGFTVNWDNDVRKKIEIANFKWRKQYDETDLRYEANRILHLISG